MEEFYHKIGSDGPGCYRKQRMHDLMAAIGLAFHVVKTADYLLKRCIFLLLLITKDFLHFQQRISTLTTLQVPRN